LLEMLIAVVEWNFTAMMEISAQEPQEMLFGATLIYVGSTSAQVGFLLFALEHTNRRQWLTRRNQACLLPSAP